MIKLYPENFDVAIDVLFTDSNGAALTVDQVNAIIYDDEDEKVMDFGQIVFDPADGKATVTIPAMLNVLRADEQSAARTLRVILSTTDGPVRRTITYIIEREVRLEVMNNTFMTLGSAEVLARDNPRLTAWAAASADTKMAALINAYSHLGRVQLRYTKELAPDATIAEEVIIRPGAWLEYTKDDFMALPAEFRKAIRTAQLIEANEILTDNPYESRHRAGVISETVGESSVMLRGGRLELGVCHEALRALTGYVYYRVEIGRA